MSIVVSKADKKDGFLIHVHTPPLLNYIVVNYTKGKPITIAIPGSIVNITDAKAIMLAITRAIEEAESIQIT